MYGYGFKYRGGGNGSLGYSNTKSLLLDGVDEYVNADGLESGLLTTTVGTWCAWIKMSDITPVGTEVIMSSCDTSANTRIRIRILSTGQLNCDVISSGSTSWRFNTDSAIGSDNQWLFIGLVQDSVSPLAYVNGVSVARTFSISSNIGHWFNATSGIDNFRIGCDDSNGAGVSSFWGGNIDEAQIYNTNLSGADMLDIYNGGCPKDESGRSGLVSYYKFGNGAGDNWNSGVANEWQFIDQKGSNNAFTVNCEEADVEADTPC